MEQPKLKVQSAKVDDLIPYANNAKIHTAEQVDQICNSILQFGFNDPVAIWFNADGEPEIVEGHGRVMAAKKLGLSQVPVITLDHLDDEARRAYTHVHNKLTMNTGFDWETLDEELANLNFDFSDYGFEVSDTSVLEDLMGEDFVGNSFLHDGEFFNVTLVFPSEKRETIERFLGEFGKDNLVAELTQRAESWG